MAAGPEDQRVMQTESFAGYKRRQEERELGEEQDTKRLRGQGKGKHHAAHGNDQVSSDSITTAHSLKGPDEAMGKNSANHEDKVSSATKITAQPIQGPGLTGFETVLMAPDMLASKGTKDNPINIDDDDDDDDDDSCITDEKPPTPAANTNFDFVKAWLMDIEPTKADGEALRKRD
ncbi:uncharacterized protein BKA78DRAFT_297897 [Phyllosticta capitalensis]|uniref:uncharacterized protein n=1 Tax=Phyllosticta capitalensis TaxID=121624 RepID=UPI003131C9B6